MNTIVSQIPGRKEFFKGIDTLKIGYPWLTFGTIMTLEYLVQLNKEMRVLELGGGGSTVFFANNCKNVVTIETDKNWLRFLIDRLKNYKNVNLVYSANETESINLIKNEHNESYDIILIDSGWLHDAQGEKISPNRRLLFETAIPKLKKDGFLIIDNYQHYGMKHFVYRGFEVYTFDEMGYSGRGTKICVKL